MGGTDQQYVSHNDSGIYVSSIKENGAAAVDGRLQEGDLILEVRHHILHSSFLSGIAWCINCLDFLVV